MTDSPDTFLCENCRKDLPASERAVFPLIVKIMSLPLAVLPMFPSFLVWPRNICRPCSTQVYLYAGGVIVILAALLLGAFR